MDAIDYIDTSKQEIALLAEMINAPAYIPDVLHIVTEDMFSTPKNREIFQLVTGMYADGRAEAISCATLYATVPDKEYFSNRIMCYNAHGTVSQAIELSKALAAGLQGRRVLDFSAALQTLAHDGANLQDALAMVHDFEQRVIADIPSRGAISIDDACNGMLRDMEKRNRIQTGYPSIDRITEGGFANRDLVILAGRPGTCKTSIAVDMACFMADYGKHPGCIFSLEMSASQVAKRMVLRTGIPVSKDFRDQNYQPIEKAIRRVEKLPVVINDKAKTIDEIATEIVLLKAQGKLHWAVIDYIGLVAKATSRRKRNANMVEVIGEVTGRLKELALQLEIPIIALSQLNRDSVRNGVDRAPELSDLRGSGDIEQDADLILMIEVDNNTEEPTQSLYRRLWVRKNRNGLAGNYGMTLKANESFSHFEECRIPSVQAAPAGEGSPDVERAQDGELTEENWYENL